MTIRSVDETPRRQRDASATRAAILDAATRRFASEGYERAGVRSIAADAGVTAALVNRYFGSKEGLFAAVVDHAFAPSDILGGDRATLAERLARFMVNGSDGDAEPRHVPLLLLLRSATEPHAAELLRSVLDRRDLRILARTIGGPEADARAAMILAQMVGFATLERMIRTEGFSGIDRESLVRLMTAALNASLDGPTEVQGESRTTAGKS